MVALLGGNSRGGGGDGIGVGIPSSADYLCTSSRDSFHCNGAKTWEASRVKPTEKCFYLARLSSLLKVRFFRGRERGREGGRLGWLLESALKPGRRLTPHRNSRKRDCGLVYPFPTSTFFFHPHAHHRFHHRFHLFLSTGLTPGEIFRLGGEEDVGKGWTEVRGERRRGEGRNCVNYPLISASDPRITPRREC